MKNYTYSYYTFLLILICSGVSGTIFSQNNSGKVIKVGVYDNPPKIFLNKNGQPDGFFIDIIKEIGERENLKFEYEFNTWDNLYKKLQTGEIDMLPDVVFSAERDSIFTLSKLPVLSSWAELFSRKELNLHSILDLKNLKVGVLKGSIEERYMTDFVSKEFDITYKLYTYDSYKQCVNDLKSSKIDVIIADRFFTFSNLFDKTIKPTGILIRPLGLHFAFTKNKNAAMVELFDRNISELKNDASSKYYKSLFHWLEKDAKLLVPSYIKWFVLVVFIVLILSLVFVLLLRQRVKVRTEELFKAKEKAGENENQLKLIADNLVNGMIYQIVTLDDNRRKFNYVSDGVVKLYGCTAAEVIEDASLIYRRIHPDDIEIMRVAELKAIHNMSNYVVEVRVINPDGSIRWAYSIAKPRIIGGLVCWDGIEFDISERKQLEIDLNIAKEKAEESDRLKSAFLANMSHEIRTPMNGILGFAELLKEPNLKGKKQRKYIKIIEKSGLRMLNIINDIINISKIESGQMEVHLQKSNINEQLEYIYTFFIPEAEKKGVQLSYKHTLPSNEAFITTDREKVFAILTNLVKNAINHTEKGSVEFGYTIKDDFLEFYVKDTGIGVPKDRQEAIFERFIQADIANKMALQGAGLGLSISKAYVEILGGSIRLKSEEGEGTVFYFTLPFIQDLSIEKTISSEIVSPVRTGFSKKLKIVIAEDDAISEKLISKVIKEYGSEIINTRNGLEAVEACRNNPDIDLVFMDIQMPIMDGHEAAREIRKFNKEVIIIAQTAYALVGDMERAIDANCNDYISKPLKVEELKLLIFKYFKD
ncbi:PAS domain S-box-containing protein [Flavobacterium gillisiae]|uniref:histidine kinase n=1 Tax=Flavobacterium gillisiae TaxID=150146 RepID=A0A1H4AAP2_9FLAO|nr:transporter substrate-binding domain-containing protein [Flavobacterium gillisiae]SEA32564.1 PAS domain S-box-containing protein [Flavobacterium gillisiae]